MGSDPDDEPPPDALLAEMDVLEPYTTDEVAAMVDAPRSRIGRLLERLAAAGKVRKKAPSDGGLIWIKAPPSLECPSCGQAAEVRFLHPVLASPRYCPRCGAEL